MDAALASPNRYVFVGDINRVREPIIQQSLYVIMVDSDLNTLWTQTITLPDSTFWATSVATTTAGEVLVGGSSGNLPAEHRLLKFSAEGELLWQRTLDRDLPGLIGIAIECIEDKIVLGSTYHDWNRESPYLAILDSLGDVTWDSIISIAGSDYIFLSDMAVSDAHKTAILLASCNSYGQGNGSHGFVISVDLSSVLGSGSQDNPYLPRLVDVSYVYPNPTNSMVSISFRTAQYTKVSAYLSNILGQRVQPFFKRTYAPGSYEVNMSLDGIATGKYYIILDSESERVTRSVTLIR